MSDACSLAGWEKFSLGLLGGLKQGRSADIQMQTEMGDRRDVKAVSCASSEKAAKGRLVAKNEVNQF